MHNHTAAAAAAAAASDAGAALLSYQLCYALIFSYASYGMLSAYEYDGTAVLSSV